MTQPRPPLPSVLRRLHLPAIAAPLFIVSSPRLVIAQCRAGIVGSIPALNARSTSQLDEWLAQIGDALAADDHPVAPAGPLAVNLIAHRSNSRLDDDLAMLEKHRVPIVITSMGARPEINDAVHAWGGIVLHDVINNGFARKAIDKGADGLIAVAAGAGGHAGTRSPFALVQEIRAWFDGPLALSGAIATGRSMLACRAIGADFAYIGSAFIATHEAQASPEYRQMILDGTSDDIVYTDLFSGVHANYLRPSVRAQGLDPDQLDGIAREPGVLNGTKAWRDIWGAGQGIAAVREVLDTQALVDRLAREYAQAAQALAHDTRTSTLLKSTA
ncbi:NAD(P)H-dependent flavin oxidoreductase [Caenimonas soli]|uniref:NAD(P)H-dependent flavin oxidoreductase n=1 Tax=Caenimonas soli TaxID=2735555 RepID=UPI001555FC8C|nr:nitronate monooxygenase family protein [Caenimonas soli]NPC59059.1 nitronate monooxygenase [Caenimonas soli]